MPSYAGVALNSYCSWQYTSVVTHGCCRCCPGNRMCSEECETHVWTHCSLHCNCSDFADSTPYTSFFRPRPAGDRQRRCVPAAAESAVLNVNTNLSEKTPTPELLRTVGFELRKAADEFDQRYKKSHSWLPMTALAAAAAIIVLFR